MSTYRYQKKREAALLFASACLVLFLVVESVSVARPGRKGDRLKDQGRQNRQLEEAQVNSRERPRSFNDRQRPRGSFKSKKRVPENFDAIKHARGSFDAGKHARGSFDAEKLATPSFTPRELATVTETRQRRSVRPERDNSALHVPRAKAGEKIRESRIREVIADRHVGARYEYQRPRQTSGLSVNLNLGSLGVTNRRHSGKRGFRHHRRPLYNSVVWPSYRRIIYYSRGPRFTFRYLWPGRHRKYVFVSLGGYWPANYRYARYYYYGYHPYYWYGSYPDSYLVKGDTNNYYTYNYYYDGQGALADSYRSADETISVDENTFADVRERLAAQAEKKPAIETEADRYFEEAVKAFEDGDYGKAVEKFEEAVACEPDDIILPFAYVQGLFADEQYEKAAEQLRDALSNLTPDEEGVFYPRGLYPDDGILFEQIDRLAEKAELKSYDSDLQLLLGYQLLGISRFDQAVESLQRARLEWRNSDTAEKLLELLEKIKTESIEDSSNL